MLQTRSLLSSISMNHSHLFKSRMCKSARQSKIRIVRPILGNDRFGVLFFIEVLSQYEEYVKKRLFSPIAGSILLY